MRLVDMDVILEFIERIKCDENIPKNYGTILDIMRFIRNVPTIQDAENMIEKLQEEVRYLSEVNGNLVRTNDKLNNNIKNEVNETKRLIDANAMLKRNDHSIYDTTDLKEMLEYEPTAYDVNNVIEQLENASYNHADYGTDYAIDTETAIDIVDGGGVRC